MVFLRIWPKNFSGGIIWVKEKIEKREAAGIEITPADPIKLESELAVE